MAFIDNLERKFGKYIPENITKILLAGQVISFILVNTRQENILLFNLYGKQLYQGEIWRLVTVLFAPVSNSILFFALALYFFYQLGILLENRWGPFRYLMYILIGYLALVICALLFPDIPITNFYLYTTLFLAFAHLYPDFRVLLFFILPVQMKWLGYFAWFSLLITFLSGSLPEKILILFSISNFLFFFSGDILMLLRGTSGISKTLRLQKQKPNHICALCGKNEIDDPDMEIRYCSQCVPTTCYCGKHIIRHQHKRPVN